MEKSNKLGVKVSIILSLALTAVFVIFSFLVGTLAIVETWSAFLFVWYWINVRNFEVKCFKYDVPNALMGIAMGYALYSSYRIFPSAVCTIASILILLIIILCSTAGFVPFLIGKPTFLYYTVLSGNLMLTSADYKQIVISYVVGVAFFVITIRLILRLIFGAQQETTAVPEPESNE